MVSSVSKAFFESLSILTPLLINHSILPIFITPLIVSSSPAIPLPDSVWMFFIGSRFNFCFFASLTKAFAIGCLLSLSKLADIFNKNKLSSLFLYSRMKGSPLVKVPVLSKIIWLIFEAISILSPPLNKTPFFAALPDATVITVGVAKPNAHGQAITKTAIDSWIAKLRKFSALLPRELCKVWLEFVMNSLWSCVNKSGQICSAPFHQKKKLEVANMRTK